MKKLLSASIIGSFSRCPVRSGSSIRNSLTSRPSDGCPRSFWSAAATGLSARHFTHFTTSVCAALWPFITITVPYCEKPIGEKALAAATTCFGRSFSNLTAICSSVIFCGRTTLKPARIWLRSKPAPHPKWTSLSSCAANFTDRKGVLTM